MMDHDCSRGCEHQSEYDRAPVRLQAPRDGVRAFTWTLLLAYSLALVGIFGVGAARLVRVVLP